MYLKPKESAAQDRCAEHPSTDSSYAGARARPRARRGFLGPGRAQVAQAPVSLGKGSSPDAKRRDASNST